MKFRTCVSQFCKIQYFLQNMTDFVTYNKPLQNTGTDLVFMEIGIG